MTSNAAPTFDDLPPDLAGRTTPDTTPTDTTTDTPAPAPARARDLKRRITRGPVRPAAPRPVPLADPTDADLEARIVALGDPMELRKAVADTLAEAKEKVRYCREVVLAKLEREARELEHEFRRAQNESQRKLGELDQLKAELAKRQRTRELRAAREAEETRATRERDERRAKQAAVRAGTAA